MNTSTVHWRDMVASEEYKASNAPLVIPLGQTPDGKRVTLDLYAVRHLLVCGVADSGKTAFVHSVLNALLAKNGPEKLRLIIIDPKKVEYQSYDALTHLLTPVITDSKKAILALKWLAKEAERRLDVLRMHKMRSIEEYHEKVIKKAIEAGDERILPEAMPYIVTVIDDLSIIMASFPREIQLAIAAVIPNAKAAGIHLLVTSARFSTHSLRGSLREHFAARLAFHMPATQSRMLLGDDGAASLTERGAARYRPNTMTNPITLQTPLITEDEIDAHTESVARKYPADEFNGGLVPVEQYWSEKSESIFSTNTEEADDELYAQAVEVVREAGKVSTSYLQRKLGVGYARAAKLVDLLEEHGVIGPSNGAAPREIIDDEDD